MPDDLDRHQDEVDDTLDDVESMFADLRDTTQDNVDDAIDEIERQRRILERMGEQDLVKALRDIERHYKTDYDEPSEARQAEDDIDAVVARHDGYPAPFSDVGLRRAQVNNGWWTTRRKYIAGAAGLLGAGIIASDAGNYAEGDEPAKGGLQLPFGDGDIDAWGALENHRAAEGSSGDLYDVTEITVTDVDRIAGYLEDVVQGSELLSADRNWGDLMNVYDFEEGVFFPDSDRTMEGLDIISNEAPGEHSEYGVSMGIDGDIEYDTRTLKDDRAAESALEYFEVNQ